MQSQFSALLSEFFIISCCVCLDVNQGSTTAAHRDLQSCTQRPTNEPWRHTKN